MATGNLIHYPKPKIILRLESRLPPPLTHLQEFASSILTEALTRNSENVSLTARVLGTTREKLRYRVQKYGLKTSD